MAESVIERYERLGSAQKVASFIQKMKMPYEFKRLYAETRVREYVDECNRRGLNYHVSVGGLDSIVLSVFLKSIGVDAPMVSVSSLEDTSIQKVHTALGMIKLKPAKKPDGTHWNKNEIIRQFGFPVLSKEIAAKIELLQAQSPKSATVRHAIITGETGAYGGNRQNTRMKMSQKWLELFGGYENEAEGVNYKMPDFLVSSKCCYYLKEKPADDWAKEHNSVPFLGLMASEGGRRGKSLKINGCNYFGKSTIRSAPFAIFERQDILTLALEMDAWYQEHWEEFGTGLKVDSIVPAIYGTIERDAEGNLHTTKAQRTGCSMCGFGIHIEKRPHRFDMLHDRNPKEWEYLMNGLVTRSDGTKYGWGHVLDYIGVEWRADPQISMDDILNIEEAHSNE